jgi:hypothetical protein
MMMLLWAFIEFDFDSVRVKRGGHGVTETIRTFRCCERNADVVCRHIYTTLMYLSDLRH